MVPPNTRFMVVDDDEGVRKRIRRLLEDEFPRMLVVEAGSAEEAIALPPNGYAAILLDNSLPGRNGLQALPDLCASQPGVPVVMVTTTPEAQIGDAARRAGATGFVSKEDVPDQLLPLLHRLLNPTSEDPG